jgi:hypothetical protein
MFGDRIPSGLRLGSVGASDGCQRPTETKHFDVDLSLVILRHTCFSKFQINIQYILKFGVREHSTKYLLIGDRVAARPLLRFLQSATYKLCSGQHLCTRTGLRGVYVPTSRTNNMVGLATTPFHCIATWQLVDTSRSQFVISFYS